MNLPLFDPVNTALHIEHCAFASKLKTNKIAIASTTNKSVWRSTLITAPLRALAPRAPTPETYSASLMTGSIVLADGGYTCW